MSLSLEKLGALATQDLGPTVRMQVFGGEAQGAVVPSSSLPDPWDQDYGKVDAIRPDHNIPACLAALEASTRLQKLVRTFARNTVGLGFHIAPKKVRYETDAAPDGNPAVQKEDDRITKFFENCNPEMPLAEVVERAVIDREATGNGYLEATRTAGDDLSGIYHVPCVNMRMRGGPIPGFIQFRETGALAKNPHNIPRYVYFKKYNDLQVMNKWTGEYDDKTPFHDRATEIVHLKVYAPDSYYYGKPRWLSALPSVLLSHSAKQWNLNFVANNASWPIAIITENAELDAMSQQLLTDVTLAKGKGLQGAGRVIFLQAQKKHPAFRGTDTRIRVEKLAMGQQDDGSFLKLLAKCDDDIRETYGVNELFLGSANDLNRASASVSRQVTNEQEFVPQSKRDEFIFNATFMRSLGAELTEFRFNRPRTTDNLQDSQILARLKPEALLDATELRDAINRLIPDMSLRTRTEPWAKVPPKVYSQEASARNAAIAASGSPDSIAKATFDETNIEEAVQQAVDDAMESLGAEER